MFPVLSSKMQRLWFTVLLISVTALSFLKCSESSAGTGYKWKEKLERTLSKQEWASSWENAYSSNRALQGVHVYQYQSICLYGNDGLDVVLIEKIFYNTKELLEFDSRVGKYVAKTDIGKPTEEKWNNDTEFMAQKIVETDTVCRHNYEIEKATFLNWTVVPKVTIKPIISVNAKYSKVLACFASGFYPPNVNVSWLRNGEKVTNDISSTGIIQNGDWTSQIHLTLEIPLKTAAKYSCKVEHSSLSEPKIVNWNPEESQSAKNKLISGIGGFVLGGIFTVVGLVIYLRNKKGYCLASRQPASFQLLPAFCFAPDGEKNATGSEPVA